MQSVVLIVPAELQGRANALGEAMGWGPANFSVDLSGTHFGCHTWASDGFVAALKAKQLPARFDFQDVMDALIWSAQADMAGHWQATLEREGLAVVEPEQ